MNPMNPSGKELGFLLIWPQNTNMEKDNIKLYHNVCLQWAFIVNECLQFKEYLGILTACETLKCPEILHLVYERNFMEVSPNLTMVLKIDLSCDG